MDKPHIHVDSPYEYQPLPTARHIRLLRSFPKGATEPAGCYQIVSVNLDDGPVYNALSYTWGDPFAHDSAGGLPWLDHKSQLTFQDGESITIGQNLSSALLCFQERKLVGDFWIDAICIHQSDIQERNAQVGMMGDIYACAEKVIVWLGDADWNSNVARVFLEKFLPKLERLKERETGADTNYSYVFTDPRLYDRLREPEISEEIFNGLAFFLERAWFRRAWTFQEVILAREIQMYCGSTEIEWNQLEKLLSFLETSDWDSRLSRFQHAEKIQQVPGRMILATMWFRNHIAHGGPEEQSYRNHLEQISMGDTPKDRMMGYLDHLLYAMRCREATDSRDFLNALYASAALFNASYDLGPRLHDDPTPEHLTFEAFHLDDISGLGENDYELGAGGVAFTRTASIVMKISQEYPITSQDRAEVFWRTLIAGTVESQRPAPVEISDSFREHMLIHNAMVLFNAERRSPDGKADAEILKSLANLAASSEYAGRVIPSVAQIMERKGAYANVQVLKNAPSLSEEQTADLKRSIISMLAQEEKARVFSRSLGQFFISKRIATTLDGFMGAAPMSAKEGDGIYILPGARMYVHGIMQGEAFAEKQMIAQKVTLS
ncbi:MAG: hypothetical protein Q9183_002012 [Haloplaca sp. 2 TL-2023]